MAKLLDDVLDRINKIEDDIETIQLGVYGDSKNEIKGLIQNVKELQILAKQLREERKQDKLKIIYFCSGITITFEVIWTVAKYFKII